MQCSIDQPMRVEMFWNAKRMECYFLPLSLLLEAVEQLKCRRGVSSISHTWAGWTQQAGGPESGLIIHFHFHFLDMPAAQRGQTLIKLHSLSNETWEGALDEDVSVVSECQTTRKQVWSHDAARTEMCWEELCKSYFGYSIRNLQLSQVCKYKLEDGMEDKINKKRSKWTVLNSTTWKKEHLLWSWEELRGERKLGPKMWKLGLLWSHCPSSDRIWSHQNWSRK